MRLWPFRNLKNFTFTVFGLTGIGLISSSIANQNVFSKSPVVSEAVKILGLNNTTRVLLGNPITYTGSYDNTYNLQEEEQFYSFKVKGSKTNTVTELTAKRMKVADIRQKIQKVKQMETQIAAKKQQQTKLEASLNKLKDNQKNEANEKIKTLSAELAKLAEECNAAKQDKNKCIQKYYIPSADMHYLVTKTKKPENLVSDQEYLYGIEALIARLPNKKVLDILPGQEGSQENSLTNSSIKKYSNINQLTEGYLKDRLTMGLEGLTEEEIESYGKHKTMMMYGKYNSYRIGLTIFLTFSLLTVFFTWHIYRIKPVSGTIVGFAAEQFFLNNRKTGDILKALKKNKSHVKFSKTIGGGRKGDSFNCSVDVDGVAGMKVYFEGGEQNNGDIKFKKFQVQYPEGKETRKVDLM